MWAKHRQIKCTSLLGLCLFSCILVGITAFTVEEPSLVSCGFTHSFSGSTHATLGQDAEKSMGRHLGGSTMGPVAGEEQQGFLSKNEDDPHTCG